LQRADLQQWNHGEPLPGKQEEAVKRSDGGNEALERKGQKENPPGLKRTGLKED